MACGLAAEGAGAFRQANSYALFVDLDYLALPCGALYQKPDAAALVCFNLHSDLCVCHITQPPFYFCSCILTLSEVLINTTITQSFRADLGGKLCIYEEKTALLWAAVRLSLR